MDRGDPVVYDDKRGYAVSIYQYKTVLKNHTYMARTWEDNIFNMQWTVTFCEV